MLTFFTVTKPFEGHIGVIQRNALNRWTCLRPECQVIIFGDEVGSGEIAAEFALEHIADIPRNEFGTPLLDSVFRLAESRAHFDLLCYANADILFPAELIDAVQEVSIAHPRFLMVGRTWNVDIGEEELEIKNGVLDDLHRLAAQAGPDRGSDAIDYFVFPRETMGPLPRFAVGRPGWDNWMIYRALSRRIPVVDASAFLPVIHQEHGYGHVKYATGNRWQGPEGDRNRALARRSRALVRVPVRALFTLDDATHVLTTDGLRPAPALTDFKGRYRAKKHLFSASVPGHLMLAPMRTLRETIAIRTRLRGFRQRIDSSRDATRPGG
jgi:hypothetical protein